MANPHNPMPDRDWRLPFDVISTILAASTPPTISALMQSCHALYAEGPKHLLRDGVVLSSADEITLFANFMLTNDPSRLAHLRKLVLSFPLLSQFFLSNEARLRLSELLSHPALGLETLILRGAEALLNGSSASGTDLCKAFEKLHTVKHLSLFGVDARIGPKIRAFTSKLEFISISADRPGFIEAPGQPQLDVPSMLRPFSATLHTLLIRLEPSASTLSLLNNVGPDGFPHIHTFGIVYHDSVSALFASRTFAQTFPVLKNLQVIPTTIELSCTYWLSRLETAVRFREENQARRSEHGSAAFPGLSSLAEFSGRLFDVYALAFNQTLPSLRLWQYVEVKDIPMLSAVLEDTHPRRLCLSPAMHRDTKRRYGYEALRAVLAQPPSCIDLNILLDTCRDISYSVRDSDLEEFFAFLKPLIHPACPPGLVELNVFVEFPMSPQWPAPLAMKSAVSNQLVAFEKWASTAIPSLSISCRITANRDWWWPDLGQNALDPQFDIMPNPFDFDF